MASQPSEPKSDGLSKDPFGVPKPCSPKLGDQVLLLNGESAEVLGSCPVGCLIVKHKDGLCEHVERESVAAITWSAGPD